ncbi:MAG: glycerophosphodiester phosphodiesterase family protein [Flavobacteriaceae bacterium]
MKKTISVVLITVFLTNSCSMIDNKPLVIGHRGAMGHETENTLASVKKAMDLGVDMIEIDVFKIKSGEIVVFHDEQVDRLSNGEGPIEEYTMSEISSLTLEGNHSIPTLWDVLELIDKKVSLNIELKGENTATDVNIIMENIIQKKGWESDHFVISSFKREELRRMREVNMDVKIAILTEEDPTEAIAIAKELNAVAINPDFKMLNKENTLRIHEEGFKIYTWTVNDPGDIQLMKAYGVDGIITNYPERVH